MMFDDDSFANAALYGRALPSTRNQYEAHCGQMTSVGIGAGMVRSSRDNAGWVTSLSSSCASQDDGTMSGFADPPAAYHSAPASFVAPPTMSFGPQAPSRGFLPFSMNQPQPEPTPFGLPAPRFVPPLVFPAADCGYLTAWPSSALPSPSDASSGLPTPTRDRSFSLPNPAIDYHNGTQDDLVPPPPTMNGRTSHSHRVPRNYVKRPPNGFLRFRSEFIVRNNSLPRGDPARLEESRVISRAAGMVWRNLPSEERDRWKREAKLALDQFKLSHPDDEASRKERARVRRRSKQRRAHAAVDDDAARRAAAAVLNDSAGERA